MAYESMTYEVILERMIERVATKYPTLDIREGSIIHNALAPAAVELSIMYSELDNIMAESFVNTASREYILLACEQIGIDTSTFEASCGSHKGIFNVEVPIGSRWSCDLYNYTVTTYLGVEDEYYTYQMECETAGTTPNNIIGNLTPITDNPTGLSYAQLVECVIEGENETTDEDIRTVYYERIKNTISDGNVYQYKQWCDDYDGIGNSKIFPLWNGANTVKVSILSASNRKATDELIAEFQHYLDPNSEGMGNGVAPIGAMVTVTTATEIPINVTADITMKNGYSDLTPISTALNKYISSLAYEKTQIAYMNIGAAILGVDGVESITNLKLNGKTADITIGNEDIPVLGTVDWTVV